MLQLTQTPETAFPAQFGVLRARLSIIDELGGVCSFGDGLEPLDILSLSCCVGCYAAPPTLLEQASCEMHSLLT